MSVFRLADKEAASDGGKGLGINAAVGGEGVSKIGVRGFHVVADFVALAGVGFDVLEGKAAKAGVGVEGGGFVGGSIGVEGSY